MKSLATVILLILFNMSNLKSQESTPINTSSIDDYYFPTNNSDFHYFFLRKNSRLSEGLVGYEVNFHENRTTTKSKLFIPIINNKKWNYTIPIYYDKHQFSTENDNLKIDNEYRNFFFQSVLNYYANDKVTLTSIIEGRIRGNEESHFESIGNMLAHYFVAKYQFSDKLAISPAILVGHQWNEDKEFVFFPSLELKWNPDENFALLAGIPGLLGIEWSATKDVDLVLHSMMDNGILTINASARKRFNKYIDIAVRYDQDGFGDTYMPSNILSTLNDDEYNYNQVYQKENAVSTILTFSPTKELLLQVKGGYSFNTELMLSQNDIEQISIEGQSSFYSGVAAYWRFKK